MITARCVLAFWRIAFFVSLIFAVAMASIPQPPVITHLSGIMLHFVSFAVLTLLARLAYPQAGTRVVFVALCALGAGIEFIQAHPALPRDASFTDWLADLLAISLVCALMSSWNWDSAP